MNTDLTPRLSTEPAADSMTTRSDDDAYPSISLLGWRLTYIRSDTPTGWGHDEGDVLAQSVFSLVKLKEKLPHASGALLTAGWRLVVGRHSLWLMR